MKQLLLFILFSPLTLFSQLTEIGKWKDYLPYKNPISVAHADDKIYVACESSVFVYDTNNNLIERLSKVNGLSDVGISAMSYSEQTNSIVIGYKSAIIDIIQDNNIYTIIGVERENIIGLKRINAISFHDESAFLSCSFGIVEIDLTTYEIKNTVFLEGGLGVNDICTLNDSIFAATNEGIYKACLQSNVLDYNNWRVASDYLDVNDLEVIDNSIYYTINDSNSVYRLGSNSSEVGTFYRLKFIKEIKDTLYIGSQRQLWRMKTTNDFELIIDDSYLYYITDVTKDGSRYWLSDLQRGLMSISSENFIRTYAPGGPESEKAFSITSAGDKLFVSPGGISVQWNNNNTYEGLFWSDGYQWFHVDYDELEAKDITKIIESPQGDMFVGTWNDGVIQLKYDEDIGNYSVYKQHNHTTTNNGLQTIESDTSAGNYGWIRIKDMEYDENGLLWAANSLVEKSLVFMNPRGEWQSLKVNSYNLLNSQLGDIVIDDYGRKWFYIAKGGGIIVYDDNNTPEIPSDDQDIRLSVNKGSGGLPSNEVLSIAKDNDGEIWIGTTKGPAVFYNPEEVFGINGDAQQVLVETGGYVEPIIANESVSAIAVDGANRKWFGTRSSGVFVYSPDGSEQIHHFDTENSPLFSNNINDISINGKTGEIFIATDKGLISYRGEATNGQEAHGNVLVYPNPIREGYTGPIAIKNITNDADVKITDIAGNLVRSLSAFGGQAVWDGKDAFGERPNSGVYLVFTSNSIGTETFVSKILFIK
ncbi:MAG: two-component regulator propeller domain-containing protein [Bacteroidota bacterium]|nr:two-component regulator propeller domain-containing protein [Bacteroidota bacterium]